MTLQDRTLRCRDCGGDFVFTAGEQGFYIEKGLYNEPQRCQQCRTARRQTRDASPNRRPTAVECAACGRQAIVPFVPRMNRPVYCDDCFGRKRQGAA